MYELWSTDISVELCRLLKKKTKKHPSHPYIETQPVDSSDIVSYNKQCAPPGCTDINSVQLCCMEQWYIRMAI